MTEIINIGDKLNLGIIKTISREIREIKNRLKKLEDNDDETLRKDLNKVVKAFNYKVKKIWRQSRHYDRMIIKPYFNHPIIKYQQDSNMQMNKPKISLKCDECGI